jgi:hypothetical protein
MRSPPTNPLAADPLLRSPTWPGPSDLPVRTTGQLGTPAIEQRNRPSSFIRPNDGAARLGQRHLLDPLVATAETCLRRWVTPRLHAVNASLARTGRTVGMGVADLQLGLIWDQGRQEGDVDRWGTRGRLDQADYPDAPASSVLGVLGRPVADESADAVSVTAITIRFDLVPRFTRHVGESPPGLNLGRARPRRYPGGWWESLRGPGGRAVGRGKPRSFPGIGPWASP